MNKQEAITALLADGNKDWRFWQQVATALADALNEGSAGGLVMNTRIIRNRKVDLFLGGKRLKGYEDKITGSMFWTIKEFLSKEFRDRVNDILNATDDQVRNKATFSQVDGCDNSKEKK